ncbi:MAG: hypothetical protein KBD26_01305 [Candidatus Pacebacteria bacterium]|nr:hypothetical protein [Candidatus Paceibacterota bacterium]MBP9772446.1 hypothetical protein [Candidatus Paceibacterota bacterium]QQR76487.1 MAG: hypothetical protein IPJ63_03250 [Candidatus Nomurabacteria bacterium]
MNFFSNKNSEDLALVLDIGSASVGGSLVKFPKGKNPAKPTIVYSVRTDLIFEEDLNFESFLAKMLLALADVVKKVHDARIGAPKFAYCTLASPWYASQTRIIKLSKNTPFVFSHKLADELIEKERKNFENEHAGRYRELGENVRILEAKTIRVSLNGYRVKDPIGVKATDLDMTLYLSMSPEAILVSIEEVIEKVFRLKKISYSSFAFASFITTRDLFVHEDNFILLDIGGELTDISIIKDGMLIESVSFPYGKNFLLRKVSRALKRTGGEALSLYRIYSDLKLEKNLADKFSEVLKEAQSEWLSNFSNALAGISVELGIPDTVFLTADKDTSSWFIATLESEEFHKYTTTEHQFRVISLGSVATSEYLNFSGSVIRDPFIMLETIFITRIRV